MEPQSLLDSALKSMTNPRIKEWVYSSESIRQHFLDKARIALANGRSANYLAGFIIASYVEGFIV